MVIKCGNKTKVMTSEDIALIALAETTSEHVKPVEDSETDFSVYEKRNQKYDKRTKQRSLFFRATNFRFRPNFVKFRKNMKKFSCIRTEEDEISMMDVPRHKSIDIGVGFARKMSLFLFTKKSVCLHPYHPFTPKQTTRKIYFSNDVK